jgi:chemosensory pili system protein ChpA (sensor histidine kinase/response regulator)
VATLWQLAAAFFEAQAEGCSQRCAHQARRSRLLAQLRASAKRQDEVSDRLAQDLLFFCAQARARRPADTRGWRRAPAWPGPARRSTTRRRAGRFDPAWIAQARKRVAGQGVWSAVAGGEMHRLAGLAEQFALVGDSLQRLFPARRGAVAGPAGGRGADAVQPARPAPAPLAMEVATGVLYLDATLEDGDFDHPELAERVQRLAQRIDDVRAGAEAQPLEPWMEELYRRVSDRQTMGSVVQELRARCPRSRSRSTSTSATRRSARC